MKILITPNYSAPYDQRMVNGLAAGFHAIGHQAHALPTPISAVEVAQKCKELSIDVVIQVNRTRHPEVTLPPKVRYISWFQDVFPETTKCFADTFHDTDILYALGDAGVLGLDAPLPCYVGSLVSGVDKAVIDYRPNAKLEPVDFSLCGFIPSPPLLVTRSIWKDILDLTRLNPLLGARKCLAIMRRIIFGYYLRPHLQNAEIITMMGLVRSSYRPLRGDLDIHTLNQIMREAPATYRNRPLGGALSRLNRYTQHLFGQHRIKKNRTHQNPVPDFSALSPFEKSINFFAREYPRLLDREALINGILQVSRSLELYGPGWNMHPEFSPYAKGVIDTQNGLLDVYRRSRINLANNTHGLGLHSRTLECMAVGGFVLTHESPHDNKPGGMLTSFEPDVHYGTFTPESLREEAHRWLADEARRRQVGQQAAEVVRQRHCWHHRAQQILDDLGR
ncbi:MAG: glycosyltransferase [Sulfuricellaceae bacterium]|nr:glycosyltransferase [Sulfuricellaceae bacterium]